MNTYVVWKPIYSVGDDALDAQHARIIQIVNELYAALGKGTERAALTPLLDRLVEYTNTHFEYEERIMREHAFPEFDAHKALHDRMRRRTADLREYKHLVTGQDLLRYLKDWWLNHIQNQDKQYTPYLGEPVSA